MTIFEKMLAITAELQTVAKNLMVGEGRNQYKAVSEGDVLAAVKPLEIKYGVYSYPVKRTVIDSGEIVSKNVYKGEEKETRRLWLRVETVYRFVNTEAPDEYIEITTYGDGVDSQDKAPGKAMTYADKYALLKAYKIMTGDDPDQNASGETKGYSRKQVDAPKEPELISDKDKEILRKTVEDKGYTVEQIFPKGIDGLTAEQYAKAMAQLKGMKPKNG
jgi:hypothetical protein